MSYSDRHTWRSATLTLNGATDLDTELAFADLKPIRIHRIGLMANNTATGGAAVTFEDRTGASTDVTIESVTLPASNVQGVVYWTDLDTTTSGGYLLEVGHRVNLAVVEGGTAPTAVALIEYSYEERADASLGSGAVESA